MRPGWTSTYLEATNDHGQGSCEQNVDGLVTWLICFHRAAFSTAGGGGESSTALGDGMQAAQRNRRTFHSPPRRGTAEGLRGSIMVLAQTQAGFT